MRLVDQLAGQRRIWFSDFLLQVVAPYLASEGVPIGRANAVFLGQYGVEWPAALPSDTEAALVYDRLFRSEEFEALASTRFNWINDREYAQALEYIDGLLTAIDAEISRH